MFRPLLSLAAIAAVLAATFVLPTETEARRCPEEMPETLLSLYKTSDVIAIATFDGSEDGEAEKTEHYTIVNTRNHYTVATTLKGLPQKMLTLEEEEYRYTPEDTEGEPVADPSEEEAVEIDESGEVKPGDTVLMFLKKATEEPTEVGEEGDEEPAGFEPIGYREGIKKMSGDVLRTYEHRINQLNIIFNSAGDRDPAVVDWLIEVTEDPITRWEGAFELLQAFQELKWVEGGATREAEADHTETPEETEEAIAEDEAEAEAEESDPSMDRLRYARLLTDGHKQALLNILLSTVPVVNDDGKPAAVPEGDQALLQLVRYWGDVRLAGFLLEQIRAGTGDRYYKFQRMEIIASSLDDSKLAAIVERYGDRLYEEGDTVIEPERSEEGLTGEPTGEVAEGEIVEPVDSGDEGELAAADLIKTYGQLRAELIAKFISMADQIIATVPQ